jgi:3-hydroxybutyryl-CoA dehydrogenase
MPEIVGDAPGGVFLRTLALLVNEAASALSDGIATVRDLDDAMQLGLNYPKGPLAWADELGVGFMVEVLQGLMDHYEEDRYRPVPLLCHLLAAGKRFYDLAGLPVQGA